MRVIFKAISMLLVLQEISTAEVEASGPKVSGTDIDEVDMLQGEVWSKIRAASSAKTPSVVEEQLKPSSTSEACMAALEAKAPVAIIVAEGAGGDLPAGLASDVLLLGGAGGAPGGAEEEHRDGGLLGGLPPAMVVGEASAAGGSSIRDNVYCCVFRYLLDILVLAVVVDGIRRWRQADGEKDSATAQGQDSWKGFMLAAAGGDAGRCSDLLRGGLSVAETDLWGCTVLHAAARGGLVGVVHEALDVGADVNQPDIWDETPLHLAARGGHAETCEALLSRAAQVNAPNAQNFTPLVVAAQEGHRATCLLLLKHGAGAAGLPASEMPPMLAALLSKPAVEDLHEEQQQDEEEEQAALAARRQWPTPEDWEEHMKESIPDS